MNFLEKMYDYKIELFCRKEVKDFYELMNFFNSLKLGKNIDMIRRVCESKTYTFKGKEYSLKSLLGSFEIVTICSKETKISYLEKMLPLFIEGRYNMEEIYSFLISEYIPLYDVANSIDNFNLECFMDSLMYFSMMMGKSNMDLLTNMLISNKEDKILERLLISYCNEDYRNYNGFIKLILEFFKETKNRSSILELFVCSLLYYDQEEVLNLFDKEDYGLIFDMLFDEEEDNFVDDRYNEGYYTDIFQGFLSEERFEETVIVMDTEFYKSFRQTKILDIMLDSLKKSNSFNAMVIAVKMFWFYLSHEDKKYFIDSILKSEEEVYISEITYIIDLLGMKDESFVKPYESMVLGKVRK